ncbi:MAG TPA: hypothetical protein VMM78_14810 [Thermomicrobiales bacterium]|nr:hypothetical protein [Thermomicrobiales bacterium]
MQKRQHDKSAESLLRAHGHKPEELSELTGVGANIIRRASYDGDLGATIVETDIVDIPRAFPIAWLNVRSEVIS